MQAAKSSRDRTASKTPGGGASRRTAGRHDAREEDMVKRVSERTRRARAADPAVTASTSDGHTAGTDGGGEASKADVSRFLQDVVRGLLAQMLNPSSATHYERHAKLIDRLLRTDAPDGFTPTMLLAGVDEVMRRCTDAVVDGRCGDPAPPAAAPVRSAEPLLQHEAPSVAEGCLPPLIRATASATTGKRAAARKNLCSSSSTETTRRPGDAQDDNLMGVADDELATLRAVLLALVQHCARPLVFLTLSDQRDAPAAVARLATALMYTVTAVEGSSTGSTTSRHDSTLRYAALQTLEALLARYYHVSCDAAALVGEPRTASTARSVELGMPLVMQQLVHQWAAVLHRGGRRPPLDSAHNVRRPCAEISAAGRGEVAVAAPPAPGIPFSAEDEGELLLILAIAEHLVVGPHTTTDAAAESNLQWVHPGVPVLTLRTLACCATGDVCITPCVDLLWSLMTVAPSCTADAIWHEAAVAGSEGEPVAMSSIFEILAAPPRAAYESRHGDCRGDVIIFLNFLLRYDINTTKSSSSATAAAAAAAPAVLSRTTVEALHASVLVLFDLVCSPELTATHAPPAAKSATPAARLVALDSVSSQLSSMGCSTARALSLRHDTIARSAPRVQNVQLKVLGWGLLATFCEWQAVRRWAATACGDAARDTPSDSSAAPAALVADDERVDLYKLGFLDVLLMYVDLDCDAAAVVAWTYEELLQLQPDVWQLLLELVVAAHAARALCGGSTAGPAAAPNWAADSQLIAAGVIPLALRYVQSSPPGTEHSRFVALSVLAALSRQEEGAVALLSYTPRVLPLLLLTALPHPESFGHTESEQAVCASVVARDAYKRTTVHGGVEPNGPLEATSAGPSAHALSVVVTCLSLLTNMGVAAHGGTRRGGAAEASPAAAQLGCRAIELRGLVAELDGVEALIAWLAAAANASDRGRVSTVLRTAPASSATPVSVRHVLRHADLVLAAIRCVTAVVLPQEVLRERFIEADGVETLLQVVELLAIVTRAVPCASRYLPERVTLLREGHSDACGAETEATAATALQCSLTLLADLLLDCPPACDRFMAWRSAHLTAPESSLSHGTTRGIGGSINATQLLLRLWSQTIDGRAQDSVQEPHNGMQRLFTAAYHEEVACLLRREYLRRLLRERLVSGLSTPVMDVTAALSPAEAEALLPYAQFLHDDVLQTAEERSAAVADVVALLKISNEANAADRGRRVAALVQRCTGLLATVYSCLRAVGFASLSHVQLDPTERAHLITAASYPSLLVDGLYVQMAEVAQVDRELPWIAADTPTADVALRPTSPDRQRLRDLRDEIHASAAEVAQLVVISHDAAEAQTQQFYQRFLSTRLRQPTELGASPAATLPSAAAVGAPPLAAELSQRFADSQEAYGSAWPQSSARWAAGAEDGDDNYPMSSGMVHKQSIAAALLASASGRASEKPAVGSPLPPPSDGDAPAVPRPSRSLVEKHSKKKAMIQASLRFLPNLEKLEET